MSEAERLYRQVIAQQPRHSDALHLLGVIAHQTGHGDAAVDLIRQAIAHNPNFADAHTNLGNAFRASGKLDEAIAAYRQAAALDPGSAKFQTNLGNALREQGQYDEAISVCRRAIALSPDFPTAHYNLGVALCETGRIDEAIAAYRHTMILSPDYPDAHANLLLSLHYHSAHDPQSVAQEHRRWNRQCAEPLKRFIQPHTNDRNPQRRMRIGYVSPDFHEHPGGRNVLALLSSHDPAQVEVFCYAHVARADAITHRIRGYAHQWRDIYLLNDAQLTDLIRRDQIDILVDLAGHTGGNRLSVFARKPAPVQVTWLGYPNTTGLTTMDYRLTDALADPPGESDNLCSEQLIRLPDTAWCFQAPTENLPLEENTLTAATPITFGSFNNFAKITAPMLQLWAQILHLTPDTKLLIKAKALRSPSAIRRVHEIMQSAGITPGRLDLQGWRKSHQDHLAAYRHVHIALDTFPYHGTTTTRDALWMGVPVVTLAGKSHVSRVGVSLLTNVGLPELIAQSSEDYIRIATELANDLPRLQNLHSTLRQRMQQSPLMDAPNFARNIEAAYRQMWHTWCQTTTAGS